MCWSHTFGICRALVLASMEVKFHVDPDTDTVVDIVAKQHLETMSMVEEFMLLANVTSAECTLKVKNCLKTTSIFSEIISLQHKDLFSNLQRCWNCALIQWKILSSHLFVFSYLPVSKTNYCCDIIKMSYRFVYFTALPRLCSAASPPCSSTLQLWTSPSGCQESGMLLYLESCIRSGSLYSLTTIRTLLQVSYLRVTLFIEKYLFIPRRVE